jgi:outer membrane protein assembly factor BamB
MGTPKPAAPLPRYLPDRITIAIAALFALAAGAAQVVDPFSDAAIQNILTLIFGFFACFSLMVWFVGFSSYARGLRFGSVAVIVGGIAVFFVFNRIERVSGTLIPQFRSRFAPPRDATLAKVETKPSEQDEKVDLKTTTENDFPQFLGPDRDLVLKDVQLERDWNQHPPMLVWRQPIGAGWSAFSVVNGYAVTLEQRGEEELVTCYAVKTGHPVWSHSEAGRHSTILGGAGPRSTPTIHEGRVYAVTALGILLCLEGETGKPVWRVDLLEKFGTDRATDAADVSWGRAGSPLIVDDMLIIPAGGPPGKAASLAAFKFEDGSLVWKGGDTQISYASPVLATIGGVRQILSVNESNATGHDVKTGEVLWSVEWPGDSSANASASQPQIFHKNHVLLSKGYSTGAKVVELSLAGDKFEASEVWASTRVLKTKFTNAAILDGYAYALSDGLLECVNLENGKPAWRGKRYGQGQILAAGDALLVMTENDGDVVMVDASPKKFVELGRFPAIEGQTWNNLCLAGKYLLVRNSQEAACFELKWR